jgi:Prenyltransferase and squalene oxidase repeat
VKAENGPEAGGELLSMTDREQKLNSAWINSQKPNADPGESRPRSNAQAVAAGREFVMSMRKDGCWTDFDAASGPSDVWVTAYVLARLGQMPSAYITFAVRQQIEETLDWLLTRRNLDGAWGYNSKSVSDAESTAWALTALTRHGRRAPQESLAFLRNCRHADGGFCPMSGATAAVDVTVVAVNSLGTPDAAAVEFLNASWLQSDVPPQPSRLESRFYLCAEILDWQADQVPRSALNKVCELIPSCNDQNAFEQALLLRCLTHLRMQKALSVAGNLRRMQSADGSWPSSAMLSGPLKGRESGLDRKQIFTTATAISALASAEIQPGLYFGSDRPLPQRLSPKRF